MWQSFEFLDVFIILNLKQIFWKAKIFFKKMEYRFLVKSTNIENLIFPYIKLPCQKSMLRQIEWEVQIGLITKNEIFPVAILLV